MDQGSEDRTTLAQIAGWQTELEGVHARIAARFGRAEVRARAQRFLAGLLAPIERRNGWQLAEQIGEASPDGVQRLLRTADWDADAVRDDLRDYVVEQLGAADGVLIVDETGFVKKGRKSVGVKRQYSGTAGRIENCQIGVFLAYASPQGHAFLDRALYLPQEWADDSERRQAAGVPEATTFQTKPQLAQAMLERALAAKVPAAWVTGDEVYGNDGSLRQWLQKRGQSYVLAVACSHAVWTASVGSLRQVRADAVVAALPADAWERVNGGAGSKGPREYDWLRLRLPHDEQAGRVQWLLARRSISQPDEIAYYRAFAPEATSLAELARVAGQRWAIEESFERAKGSVGLDQYEVRKWAGWYRHITLCLLAHAFLEVTRARARASDTMAGPHEKGGAAWACCLSRLRRCAACS